MCPNFETLAVMDSPIGRVGLRECAGRITSVDFLPADSALRMPSNPALEHAADELTRYFDDPAHGLDIPVELGGTPYQQRVWQALREIPSGRAMSYQAVAEKLGSGARAVGGACRANPCPLIVPCHRVVASHGLGGFAGAVEGAWPAIKRWLLRHERVELA